MIENVLDKLKAWEEIENRAIDVFGIYRTEACKENPKRRFGYLDYIDVNFNKQCVTLNFDELLTGHYGTYSNCVDIDIPFEYFSGEKDVKEYIKTLNI